MAVIGLARRSRSGSAASSSLMARQASWTAPPAISVSRDAELDPADPTPVSGGCRITWSTPSSVRAICVRIVWTPPPHSTAAVWTSAIGPSGPSESVTFASVESSKPSL